jgi:chemotaxis protein MotB
MKFDEGAQAEKLSLNITPLIDVVFLLVLFFAVTSTFISSDEFSMLKDKAAAIVAQNMHLQHEIIHYRELQSAYTDIEQRLADLRSQEQVSKKRAEDYASKLAEQAAVIQQLDNDYRNLRLNHARTLLAKQGETEQLNLDLRLARTKITQIEGDVSSLEQGKRALQAELAGKTEQVEALSRQLLLAFQTNQALKEEFIKQNKTLSDNKETELMLREKISEFQSELDRSRELAEPQSAQMESLRRTQVNLSSSLNRHLAERNIDLTREQNRLVLHLPDKVLFDSGSAVINPQGIEVLQTVGEILKSQMGNLVIQVGGHTDNVPVGAGRRGQITNNWDLSAARAVNVVHFLESQTAIDPSRMSAVGYGEHRPVASNETEAGRALNRRIEIVLLEP